MESGGFTIFDTKKLHEHSPEATATRPFFPTLNTIKSPCHNFNYQVQIILTADLLSSVFLIFVNLKESPFLVPIL